MTDPAAVRVTTVGAGVARLEWPSGQPIEDVQAAVAAALADHRRVEAWVDPDDKTAQRVATWSGLRREGIMRGVTVEGEPVDRIVYARLADDLPAHEPEGFRALLNSFLPRKRAISQMLIRDREGRVLLCRLTYKQDWDLPGGVVEVGESPQLAVAREVEEELALQLPAGRLLLTDWLPPWSGWDDAVCLVFDGGVHDASLVADVVPQAREIVQVRFCTMTEVHHLCADFTARRIDSALAALESGGGPVYTESGRPV
ncbi:MAG TPA: NUDIX hydrolase [Nocardioides sp.]|uniref:NUDIX hydrolase n=1 Tax=Nocardioides sp. TaxID=35761 RepID=UPI002E3302DB|nr:NUDIX hydrolase [Nocardioides sp.]HEX5088978.1 NUDIX hydrolase [Nocardioides sp.]